MTYRTSRDIGRALHRFENHHGLEDKYARIWIPGCTLERQIETIESQERGAAHSALLLPTILRYVVARSTRPHFTQALPVCEHLRTALIQLSDGMSVFSGHDVDGGALQGNQHAYIFAEPDGNGLIGHLTLYCRVGFTSKAQQVAQRLERLWSQGKPDILLILHQCAFSTQIGGYDVEAAQSPQLETSCIWESVTPFVPVRHAKSNKRGEPKLDAHGLQIGSPMHDLLRLARQQGLPPIAEVAPISPHPIRGRDIRWQDFVTQSQSGGVRGRRHGNGYRVEFCEPVRGPLLLGFGKHRGLGAFTAIPRVYRLYREGSDDT